MSEKEILHTLSLDQHPFIVNLAASFQDSCHIYMVLECVLGGEFFSHLRNAEKFSNHAAKFFAAHVVLIFEFLHAKDIIYRDLKPEVSYGCRSCLCDRSTLSFGRLKQFMASSKTLPFEKSLRTNRFIEPASRQGRLPENYRLWICQNSGIQNIHSLRNARIYSA